MARPGWIPTPERLEQVESYAALGLNKQQIADCLGIHYDTLNEKNKAYPEFSEALSRGQSKGIARMTNLLLKHAEAGNSSSVIFYLKARAKWSDNPDLHQLKDDMDELKKLMLQYIAKESDDTTTNCREKNNEEQMGGES